MTRSMTLMDAKTYLPAGKELERMQTHGLSALAQGLVGSEILKIASEIRAMCAAGKTICNLTVGDFGPAEFRIPAQLESLIASALHNGETNYPPSDGVLELRQQVVRFYESRLGLSYPLESVLIAGGSRPVIYATYAAIVDPGDKVLYPVPSWNNNHYTYLSRAEGIQLVVGPETNFLPTAELIAPYIRDVRLICINTPLNPTGTALSAKELEAIARLVVDENERRRKAGERFVYIMFDHVYWTLTFGETQHHTPPELVPESTPWTIFVDGISKAFAATGVRVGWAVAPPHVAARMRDIIGHIGAWAPRAEQIATARFLADDDAVDRFHQKMIAELRIRLEMLHDGIQAMRRDGLPVDSVSPQGAIYLSAQFQLLGREHKGRRIESNEAIRRLLLEEAGFAVVPFQAFGLKEESGWMRLSAGAVSPAEIEEALQRVRTLLTSFRS